MFQIKKIETLNLECVNSLENFLSNYSFDSELIGHSNCDKLYQREDYTDDVFPITPIESSEFSKFKNEKILEDTNCIIEFLKIKYNARIIWLNTFYPNSILPFHIDHSKNRHILSLNDNERFFNYEYFRTASKTNNEVISELNEKLNVNDLDNFNEYFLNYGYSKIINLDKNSIYSFGDTIHTFVNGSNKLRAAFVFEF